MATATQQTPTLHMLLQQSAGSEETYAQLLSSPPCVESAVIRIKRYLQQVLYRQQRNNFIKFPSVEALTNSFHVSPKEIQLVLHEFRQMGFDYEIIDNRETILVWDRLLLSSLHA